MTNPNTEVTCNILVTGDVCQDVYIATTHNLNYHNLWRTGHEWASINHGPGCAVLLHDLLDTLNGDPRKFNLFAYLPGREDQENWTQSLNLFKEFKKNQKDKEWVWRIASFLGQQSGDANDYYWWQLLDPSQTNIVVIDEKNLGFRNKERIHSTLEDYFDKAQWIIYRMARPLCKGELWKKMSEKYPDKLIVVFTISDLRYADVQVGQSLSWERLVEDIFDQLANNKAISGLTKCVYMIVSFDDAGALLHSKTNGSSLFFCPTTLEGQHIANIQGRVTGYAYCLISSLAQEFAASLSQGPTNLKKIITKAIHKGINAEFILYENGYEAIKLKKTTVNQDAPCKIKFPFKRVTDYLHSDRAKTSIIKFIELDGRISRGWSIVNTEYECEVLGDSRQNDNLDTLIKNIIAKGADKGLELTPLPYWKVSKKLILVNRDEIESLRGIESLVREYIANADKKGCPLSFAMFGPPGSGKSFTVKQMAEENDWNAETLTFNLSQFSRAEDLFGAFHQVRSVGLKGKLPLVFWDEFDTVMEGQELGWLRLFLAPMQDGQFFEGQLTHSIGRALFVFAGGTVKSMNKFDKGKSDKNWKNAKGPDFVSRLSGFVDVRGINMPNDKYRKPQVPNNECKIRRAILLRSLLERYAPNVFPVGDREVEIVGSNQEKNEDEGNPVIDKGLTLAFLTVPEYKHGARSMEAIISGSHLSGQRKYTRSALPPRDTLNLHVDDKEFFALMTTGARLPTP